MAKGLGGRRARSSFGLQLSRPVREFLRRFSLLFLLIAALFLLYINNSRSPSLSGFVSIFNRGVMDAIVPLESGISVPVQATNHFLEEFQHYFFVYNKNQELRQENQVLQQRILRLSELEAENVRLNRLLNYVGDLPYYSISARVVGNTSGPVAQSTLLNAGSKHGVYKGQPVVGESGLIGRVIEVADKSSRVLLLTDVNSKVPVISNHSRERAILGGASANRTRLLYLPKDTELTEGEIILTSGDGGFFPPSIPIGVVVSPQKGEFFVKLFSEWHKLEHVSILTSEKPPVQQDQQTNDKDKTETAPQSN